MSYFDGEFEDYYRVGDMDSHGSIIAERVVPWLWGTKDGKTIDIRSYTNLRHLINIKRQMERRNIHTLETYEYVCKRIDELSK